MGDNSLSTQFPRLLQLSTEEEISLSAILSRGDLSNEWDFNFIRALHTWEESEVSRLTVLLGTSPSLQLEQGDSMRWKANQIGDYKVSNAYRWCGWLKGPAFSSTDLI